MTIKISKASEIFLKKAQDMVATQELDQSVTELQQAMGNPAVANAVVDALYENEALYNEFVSSAQSTDGTFAFDAVYDNGRVTLNFPGRNITPALKKAIAGAYTAQLPKINSPSKFTSNISWPLF